MNGFHINKGSVRIIYAYQKEKEFESKKSNGKQHHEILDDLSSFLKSTSWEIVLKTFEKSRYIAVRCWSPCMES